MIVQTLNNDYSNLTYYCKSRFFEFILSNHVNEGYDFYLDRLKGNSDFCFNSIADAVKDEIIRVLTTPGLITTTGKLVINDIY